MEVMNYIMENALVLVPVLVVIGQLLKTTPNFPDWGIPWALMVLGVVGACAMIGWTVIGAIQGVLVAGMAVYGNQLWKQTQNKIAGNE